MSTNIMLTFKVVLISTSVLSVVTMLKFSVPAITDFAVSEVPSIYNGVVSWLRPPYLYLVINCIIITIVASSKLQSKKDNVFLSPPLQPLDTIGMPQPAPAAPMAAKTTIQTDYPAAEYNYNDAGLNGSSGYDVKVEKGLDFSAYERVPNTENEQVSFIVNAADSAKGVEFVKDAMNNKENEYVIAKPAPYAPQKKDLTEYSPSNVKPLVSVRFGHRRNVKASPEGSKTVLGVSKPKRHDTLESTWKTITEGRAVPLTRHLRKSDTWERDSHVHGGRHHLFQEKTPQKTTMKSETFHDRTNTRSPSPASGGSGKLKREPSLGQDELNRRVEAFIKKFNEEMRLQRQESLNQYMEMINRGAH